MVTLKKAREVVTAAGESIRDAMKVAIFACVLSALALVIAIMSLTRTRAPAAAE